MCHHNENVWKYAVQIEKMEVFEYLVFTQTIILQI